MKNIHGLLLVGCSALALAGCGPSDIAAPGTGGDININNPAPTPTPTPTPTDGGSVTAASSCPTIGASTQLKDDGVTVNAVLPSIIDTPTNRKDMPKADPSTWVAPADLAAVMLFLASEAARAVTGALLPVTNRT